MGVKCWFEDEWLWWRLPGNGIPNMRECGEYRICSPRWLRSRGYHIAYDESAGFIFGELTC